MKRLLLFFLLTQLAGCKVKDPFPTPQPPTNQVDLLPPATQTGQRTFGCLLNGQAWNQAGNPFGGPIFTTQYFSGNLLISCKRDFNNNQGVPQADQVIVFRLESIQTAGTYTIDGSNGRSLRFSDYLSNCTYTATNVFPAQLQITRLDLVNRVVSGRFSFTLEAPACDKVVVSEGRFDSLF